jgi:hypothetical protein
VNCRIIFVFWGGSLSGVIFNFLVLDCDMCFSLLIFGVTVFLNIAV